MFRNSLINNFHQRRRVLLGASLLTFILCQFLTGIPGAQASAQVTLAWDPNSETELAGYKVYYGTSTRNYAGSHDAGGALSYTFSDLQEGTTFYFAATAYDRYGNESAFSEEVVYAAPAANHEPVAANGVLSTNQDTASSGTLSATDPDGNALTFSVVSQGALGTAVITNAASGAYTYTPTAGVKGSDSFTFQVTDAGGLSSTASVTVTIIPVNHAPVAANGVLSTNQDAAAAGSLTAADPDGDVLTFSVMTQGSLGTVVITNAATGAYTYTPTAGAKGSDSFTFRAADGGGLSSTASVTVTIIPVNHAPVAANGVLSTNQDTAAAGSLTAADPDGDVLTFSVMTQGSLGTVVITNAATGAYTYTPTAGTKGSDSFTFRAADAGGLSSTASVAVTIIPVNHAPVAANGVLSTNQDTAAGGSLTAADPDGDVLTFSVMTQGSLGTVVITNAATGAYTYTPTAGAKGSDSFTFRAADAGGLSSTASVAVTIIPVNHAPVAQNGTLLAHQDMVETGRLTATDPDGDTLTYIVSSQGAKGTVTITGATSGVYTYTPNSGAKGSDSFTFRVADAGGLTSTATIAVDIVPRTGNQAPTAQSGVLSTTQGSVGSGVLMATDPDGDALTYSLTSQASKGAVVITNASAGTYTYTPNAGVVGADSFTFQARDPGGLTGSATVAVTITPLNRAPVANNGTLSTVQDAAVAGKLSATDADADALTYSLVSTAKLGTISLNAATGSFTYTPSAGKTGSDTFTFKANDGKVDSNVASVTVTINAYVTIQLEAEQGVRIGSMYQGKDSKASGGKYIYVPNGFGAITDPLSSGGQAFFTFTVPTAGTYRIWGRVMASSTTDNSFFVSVDYQPSIAWHTAIGAQYSWAWDVVTDQNDAEPSSFVLTAGTHTLIIKQMEDGTKLDAIAITTHPNWIPATVYADAESGAIDGWDVFDADPAGAVITNVFDEDRNSHVIQVAGSTTNNGYRLRSSSNTDWANSSQFVIEWSMKYGETYMIYVEVETNKGYRYFQYEPLPYDLLGRSSQIRLGLGTDTKDGQWHTFVRDLQADLTKAQPGTTILKVNAFSVRGSGRIGDVKLRSSI